MNEIFPLFFFLIFIVLGFGITIFNHERNLSRIRQEVNRKGFKVGRIKRQWIDFDENTATYIVHYADEAGYAYETQCKIRNIFIIPGNLYWTEPLTRSESRSAGFSSNQQLELDALRRENAALKTGSEPFFSNQKDSRANLPTWLSDLEADGLRKENEELKRQNRILRDQNQRFRKELGRS